MFEQDRPVSTRNSLERSKKPASKVGYALIIAQKR
jgi:hypothetical protein